MTCFNTFLLVLNFTVFSVKISVFCHSAYISLKGYGLTCPHELDQSLSNLCKLDWKESFCNMTTVTVLIINKLNLTSNWWNMNGLVPVLYGCTKNQPRHSNLASRINFTLNFPEEMIIDEKKNGILKKSCREKGKIGCGWSYENSKPKEESRREEKKYSIDHLLFLI